jgi:hypothetical protein
VYINGGTAPTRRRSRGKVFYRGNKTEFSKFRSLGPKVSLHTGPKGHFPICKIQLQILLRSSVRLSVTPATAQHQELIDVSSLFIDLSPHGQHHNAVNFPS